MTRTLLVGFNKGMLGHIDSWAPRCSVVVIEDPDVYRKKGHAAIWQSYACVERVALAAYHRADDFLTVGEEEHERSPFDAVMPCMEYAVPAAAAMAAKLGLHGATEGAALTLRDKIRLREVTGRAGIRGPAWREVLGPDDVRAFVAGGPSVLKPANRQASLGVQLLDSIDEVENAWRRLITVDESTQLPDRELRWRHLVEQRMFGREYSVEALVRGGVVLFENVTEKTLASGPFPVEIGHLVPAPIDLPTGRGLSEAMRELVAAIGFDCGILHAEWILTRDGPMLVECAGRFPGDRIMDLIDLAYGWRMSRALVDLLAGRPVELPGPTGRAAAIRYLSAEPGRVIAVRGVEQARAAEGVMDVEVTVGHGGQVRRWESSWDRIGHVLVTADTPEQARALAVRVAHDVQIETA